MNTLKMVLNGKVILEADAKTCRHEMMKRNLSYVNQNDKFFYVSEEIFADFGSFYTDI